MPKQMRYAIKQSLETACKELTKSMDKVLQVGQMFQTDHPDYYEAFCEIAAGQKAILDAIIHLKDAI